MQRILDESTKNHVKKLSEEAERMKDSRRYDLHSFDFDFGFGCLSFAFLLLVTLNVCVFFYVSIMDLNAERLS